MATPATFREQAVALESLLTKHSLIRAVNFHNTPRSRLSEYDQQLAHYSQSFEPVTEDDLDGYLQTGHWSKPKPGLIVACYNGYRDNFEVFFPLLQRYGFIGWFFVATTFVSTPTTEQPAFIARRQLRIVQGEYPDGRYALSWNELKELQRHNHVIASHTRTHSQVLTSDPASLEPEIVGPQQDFEAHLGHRVRSFASLSGTAFGENPAADRLIKAAGYQFVFSNLEIQRLRNRSDSDWPTTVRR
jgi:peptidoglycan/xylan/chitin deacetylase (PgdA/CDA1 family)